MIAERKIIKQRERTAHYYQSSFFSLKYDTKASFVVDKTTL